MAAKRYLVIGLGRFGTSLALSLAERGAEVVAIDRDLANLTPVQQHVSFAAQLDATDPAALAEVDSQTCAEATVAMGQDFESAVLCVAALRELGVKHIVARARTERQARILTVVGATRVLQIERDAGHRLALDLVGAG
jgi:trk system potassium uptake protein TrkA